MKKNLQLSKNRIVEIKRWLLFSDEKKERSCPFLGHCCQTICAQMFLRLKGIHDNDCPCGVYTLAHVKRVARKYIDKGG